MKSISFILAGLIATSFNSAQADRIRLTNGNIIDVETGDITQSDILIEDERIIAVGAEAKGKPVDRTIDMEGQYLLPGLSDAHVHLTSRADVHGYRRAHRRGWLSCLLYTSPSPRDRTRSRMPSSA